MGAGELVNKEEEVCGKDLISWKGVGMGWVLGWVGPGMGGDGRDEVQGEDLRMARVWVLDDLISWLMSSLRDQQGCVWDGESEVNVVF